MVNYLSDEWDDDRYDRRLQRLAARSGASALGATLYELEPGVAVSPYHLHHANEEMLLVVSGTPSIRTPDGVRALTAGDVVAFPAGPAGAHRVFNASDAPARVIVVSTMLSPEVAEYPDNGTLLAMTGPGQGRVFAGDSDVDHLAAVEEGMRVGAERDRDANR